MDANIKKDYIKLNISVLLAGLTGILGKLIDLDALYLVWYRLFLSFAIFYVILFFIKKLPQEKFKDVLKICGLGALLGLHFLFFFASIKYANVAIGVVCYSLEGFFTAILEPVICKKPFHVENLLCSVIAVFGISLIFNIDPHFHFGIILGIISAVLIALYTILNKAIAVDKSPKNMLFYELLGGALFLSFAVLVGSLIFGVRFEFPTLIDWSYLFILGFFCTIALYILQIQVLRTLSAFTVSLYGNFEPIYGTLLAILFLGEGKDLNLSFYLGMGLILLSVFLQSFVEKRKYIEKIVR